MIILLDAGHGIETAGKRSPDESIREYKYCREIRDLIKNELVNLGFQVQYVSEGTQDVPLRTRCVKVNEICSKHGLHNCLLVSIHLNAAGNEQNWTSASGWSSFVYSAASNKSRQLATFLGQAAQEQGLKIRKQYANKNYWEANFAICRNTNCPAVLTENLFQDNKDDVNFLLSAEGKKKIVDLHVQGILRYINFIQN